MTPALDPALLAAILDPKNDGDDFLRLQAADWWEENGQSERGTFIRVQVELAAGEPCQLENRGESLDNAARGLCRRCDLRRRERELLEALYRRLFDSRMVPFLNADNRISTGQNGAYGPPIYHTFRRGFVEVVECDSRAWLAHADRLLAAQPVREVTLSNLGNADAIVRRWQTEIGPPASGHRFADMLTDLWPHVRFELPANEGFTVPPEFPAPLPG